MSEITVERTTGGIAVQCGRLHCRHETTSGGTLVSVEIDASKRNLLRRAAGSLLTQLAPDGSLVSFAEEHDQTASLRSVEAADGAVTVIAEGAYAGLNGQRLPVGYRRNTEYTRDGVIWTTLEIMSDVGCEGVVQLSVLELALKDDLTDCFARFHPTQAGGADLLGGSGHFVIQPRSVAFVSRFTPLQLTAGRTDGVCVEVFPSSELAQWDTSIKPDAGLGHYEVSSGTDGTALSFSPYAMTFRRLPARIQGTLRFKLGLLINGPQPRATQVPGILRVSPPLPANLAQTGGANAVAVVPPPGGEADFVEQNLAALQTLLQSAHASGLEMLLQVSAAQWHPGAAGFAVHARNWMHMAAPSLDLIRENSGGENSAWMCLRSGWLEQRKQTLARAFKALPWDGLLLEHFGSHPCCHPLHARGPHHSDIEEALNLLQFCRGTVGEGVLVLSGSGGLSLLAQAYADAVVPPPQRSRDFPLHKPRATLQ